MSIVFFKQIPLKVDNGLIGEGRELNPARNIPALAGDSSTLRLAPPLFLEFIVAHSTAGKLLC
jgi:hypothetical protein